MAGRVVVPANDYLVFLVDVDAPDNGGVTVDNPYNYPGNSFSLGNDADAIVLRVSGRVIDSVSWDGGITFPDPSGASMSLRSDRISAIANDQGPSWCVSVAPITAAVGSDRGSPGVANADCP